MWKRGLKRDGKYLRRKPAGRNRAMMELKLRNGTAVDVSAYAREGPYYVFPAPPAIDMDYVDPVANAWIWTIARRLKDNKILAGGDAEWDHFFGRPEYEVLWGR